MLQDLKSNRKYACSTVSSFNVFGRILVCKPCLYISKQKVMQVTEGKNFLDQYIQNRLPSAVHAMFEEGEDTPAFTNDYPGAAAEPHRYTV